MSVHPDWCVPFLCTATGHSGAHRSRPAEIDAGVKITANLYAPSSVPDMTLVEIRCAPTLLSPDAAYGLGRVLVSLGRSAGGNGA